VVSAALVTGSAAGIGRGIALALAGAGYDVAVHYRRSRDEADKTRREAEALGVRAVALGGDVTDLERAGELVREAHAELGSLAVLVNNVGNLVMKPLAAMEPSEWNDVLATNLSATFATCREAVPIMRSESGGRIVNLGYAGAQNLVARPGLTAYALAKTGVVLLTKAIAKAEAPHGITANVVSPGIVESSVSPPQQPVPAGREARIEEIAAAVLWLVSPQAEYVTGQVIEVAGGWNL
jgi:NAD(P)-dependent dehydrogenase (short-subunit alcohol dehydrogenase family)